MPGRAAGQGLSDVPWVDGRALEDAQAVAQQGFRWAQEFYRRSAAASHGGARVWADVAETAWSSVKLLNDNVVRSLTANADAAFEAAEACARAESLDSLIALQGDFVRRLLAQTSEQTREFIDLSVRASQHLAETIEDAALRLRRMDF
ncbi:MAG: phasin family protein [Hyphomicrobiaceae bacterium]|nr:phasin family protein [Hyphomicrobiaceae bacterium]